MVTTTAKRILIPSAIAWWLAGGSTASAENGLVLVGGGAGERERATVGAAFESVARGAGWSLPPRPLAKKDSDALLACSDSKQPWDCIPAQLRAIRRMLVVDVERRTNNGAPMVVLTGKAVVPSERVVVIEERYCEPCADGQLGAASVELANGILRELAVRSGRTTLAVRSTPIGAQIILDGNRLGATDASFSTFPGTHMVILEKPGFLLETRTVTLEDGKTEEVTVELRSSGLANRPKPPRSLPSRLPPALVFGAGATLFATGVVFLLFDEDVRLEGKQPERYFDSAKYGVGYALAGGAIAAGGAVWWMRRTKARAAPAVSVTPAGGSVGWIGTF